MIKWLLLICFLSIASLGSLSQWEKRSVNLTCCNINKLIFVNNDTGLVFGDSGFIAITTDAGNIWSKISVDTNIFIYDACFIPPNRIMATGRNGAFITSANWGKTWDVSAVNMKYDNLCIFSFDGSTIWIGSDYGKLFNSIDSGKTWKELNLSNNGTIFSMYFTNPDTGWVGGSLGSFYLTTNGGQEWIEPEQIVSDIYNEIYFKNSKVGWAIGDRIQNTNDGGKTWVVQQNIISQVMRGMCFIDSLNGIVAADRSIIIFTTDGGISWDTTSINISYIYPFDIVNNQNDLWIVGRNGMICKSTISQASIIFKPASISIQSNNIKKQSTFNLLGQFLRPISISNQLTITFSGLKYNKSIIVNNNNIDLINNK